MIFNEELSSIEQPIDKPNTYNLNPNPYSDIILKSHIEIL
jgi:hypothetical protein